MSRRVRAAEHGLFLLVPLLVTLIELARFHRTGVLGVDFRREYWVAGWRLVHGGSPYAWSGNEIAIGVSFPYPALAALAFVPFALLPLAVSEAVFIAVAAAALAGTLRLLDVRDWRLYGIAFASLPVVAAWQTANMTLLLVLGLAALWRWRDRPAAAGLVAAVLVSLKPLMLPVLVWLLATRRHRAVACAAAIGLTLNALAWALVGIDQVTRFAHLTSLVSGALWRTGYGLLAIGSHIGLDRGAATVLAAAVVVVLAGVAVALGRRGRDRDALAVSVLLMLAASPVVWNHYFALLIVPLAIARPRLSSAWVALVPFWLCPSISVAGWEAILAWVLAGAMGAIVLRTPQRVAAPERWRAAAPNIALGAAA